MATCCFCGNDYPDERKEIGRAYCTARPCVARGLDMQPVTPVRLILMPKQGFTFVFADSDDLKTNGKSSGR